MVRKRRSKRLISGLVYLLIGVVTLVVQSGVCPFIAIRGVMPSLLPVAAAVAAVYSGSAAAAMFGGLCGLFMDALVPGVGVWFYTALLAVVCGAAGEMSSRTTNGGVFSALFWSAVVLVVTGAVECLVFGVIRGGGAGECALRALWQGLYSLPFAVVFCPVMHRVTEKLDIGK